MKLAKNYHSYGRIAEEHFETSGKRLPHSAKVATLQLKSTDLQAFPRADYSMAWLLLGDMSQRGICSMYCRNKSRKDGLLNVLNLDALREYRTTALNAASFI